MKKLNNKGMTSVEVLMSFIVVVMITVSMYSVVSAYQNKQQIESFKEKVMTYKNLLTKEINDDLIKKGLIAVKVQENILDKVEVGGETHVKKMEYVIEFTLRNGQQKKLIITSSKAAENGSGVSGEYDLDDEFIIAYGDPGNEMEYPLPDLGSTTNENNKKVYDLRINIVEVTTNDSIFSLMIGFVHPELENRYNISIVCPINF